jgi:hypothetical protein
MCDRGRVPDRAAQGARNRRASAPFLLHAWLWSQLQTCIDWHRRGWGVHCRWGDIAAERLIL